VSQPIIFGAFIPQGWKMELAGIESPQAKWAKAVEIAKTIERLGFDSAWVYDHFHNVPRPAHETVLECWTVTSAISQLTSTVRLGQMVGCNSYRQPSLLAKITSTIDVISGGRLDFGLGAGWYDHEYRGYGYEFGAANERLGMLREAVQIIRAMWSEQETSFDGKYYKLDGAQCDPKPLQQPHPPILIGGGGEKVTLRIVARYADRSNFGGRPDQFAAKCEILKEHCKAVGRDYDEIVKTTSGDICIRENEAELRELQKKSIWSMPYEDWVATNLVGTPDQVSEKIQKFVDLGCGGFIPWCTDYPDDTTLRLFAERVMPNYR
jgi:F420-dependent oxidoreductase-like protein